ncbi:MAG: tetratricopeptide repeat protein, partial [Acidobacteriota bacterium]
MLSRTSWRPSRRTGPFHVAARVAGSALLLLTLGCQLAPPLSSPVGPRARHAAIERAMEPFDIKDGELHARPGRGPAHPSALRNGLAAMERGDALDALHHLAVAVRPSSPDAYLPLARVLRRLHQLDRAAATLRRVIALEPDHADARYELGMVLTSAGRHSEAAVVFEGLTALAPERGDAHARLAA